MILSVRLGIKVLASSAVSQHNEPVDVSYRVRTYRQEKYQVVLSQTSQVLYVRKADVRQLRRSLCV